MKAPMSQKQFKKAFSEMKPGQTLRIKSSGSWERFIGYDHHRWFQCTFVSFDGYTAQFSTPDSVITGKLVVGYKDIKTGKTKILFSEDDVFTITKEIDPEKHECAKLWNPGKLYFYK